MHAVVYLQNPITRKNISYFQMGQADLTALKFVKFEVPRDYVVLLDAN